MSVIQTGIIVSSGMTSSGCIIEDSSLMVMSGGMATDTTVRQQGTMTVYHGGVAQDTSIASGGMMILQGIHAGTLQIASGATVMATTGTGGAKATLDFTLNQPFDASQPLVSNWALIQANDSTLSYSLTVNMTQNAGTFILADNAAGFDSALTIASGSKTYGTLSVGQTRKVGEHLYTLSKNSGNLTLTVSAALPSIAQCDADGNVVSDVMFQYTGGDYQLGFWMNGTNSWRSQAQRHPAEWDVLGAYDMTANGIADAVLVGNVVVNQVKGAYIGYYVDCVDTDANWRNIGYLTNSDNITWINKVGNVTGNANKNSIIWHAPELSALGVWTDGTDNWVSISGGFDANWSLQGAGDFNGDGKDEILFSFGGSFYSVDIDSNFTSLGGFGAGWEVRAIGDFHGDFQEDFVLFHETTGSMVLCENGQASDWSSLGQLDANDWFVVGAGDYNNDQRDDLLVRQYSTGMLGYYDGADTSKWVELGRGVDMNWTVIA